MSTNPAIRFTHNHHLLAVKGTPSELDVLAFEGGEALSRPFSYRIEFTSIRPCHQQRDDADEGRFPDAAGPGGAGLWH